MTRVKMEASLLLAVEPETGKRSSQGAVGRSPGGDRLVVAGAFSLQEMRNNNFSGCPVTQLSFSLASGCPRNRRLLPRR